MQIYEGKGGRYVTFEKTGSLWVVMLRSGAGEVMDKVRCDEHRLAVEYRKAFLKAAKAP